MSVRKTDLPAGCSLFMLGVWAYGIVAFIWNLIKLSQCDFNAPYKEEVIHAIGLFVPPASLITCWL